MLRGCNRSAQDDETTRRSVIGGAAVALGVWAAGAAGASGRRLLPPGDRFLFGVATAAHQVEGGNANSDVWLLEGLPGTPFAERSGDACDHYHLFEEDVAMISGLGFGAYRFSIEWARVEPAPGLFSQAEIGHYRRVLEACRRHGLRTVVTLHHFTSPLWFAAAGGFESAEAPAAFSRYASRVAEELGGLIDCLCTFNEANLTFGRRPALIAAAARATGSPAFSCFLFDDVARSKPIVRAAHAAARSAIRSARPSLPVGMTLAMSDHQGVRGGGAVARAARSAAYDAWLDAARGDDFVGVQTYTRELFGPDGPLPVPPGAVRTQIGQEFYPSALGATVRYAAERSGVPVVVTENGVGIADDRLRIRYVDGAMAALARCIADGVDVRGYLHWSAMDNWEWTFGYAPRFGLVAVDRATQRRTPKPSARLLAGFSPGPARGWSWRRA